VAFALLLESNSHAPEDCFRRLDVDPQYANGHIIEEQNPSKPIR